MDANQDESADYAQILYQLKSVVESLLDCQSTYVWNIYGGLNRLFTVVAKIFKHGFRIFKQNGEPDCWIFIQGLNWLQPALAASPSFSNTYSNASPLRSPTCNDDKAMIWLYRSLESHTLSEKLSCLLSDQEHLVSCYNTFAFLRQSRYAEATLTCIRAVEQNLSSLLTEIDPTLYLRKGVTITKSHRRCTSYPETSSEGVGNNKKTSGITELNSLASLHTSFISTKDEINSLGSPLAKQKYKVLNIKILESIFTSPECEMKNKNSIKQKTLKRFFSSNDLQEILTNKNHSIQNRYSSSIEINLKEETGLCGLTPPDLSSVLKINYNVPGCGRRRSSSSSIFSANSDAEDGKEKISNKKYKRRRSSIFKLPFHIWEESDVESQSNCSEDSKTLVPFKENIMSIPKKSFIEDGGNILLPMSIGFFPKPSPGQSLISFLSSGIFTQTNAELDRENAHFNISEAMIGAIEQIKCNQRLKIADEILEESDEEINELKRIIQIRRRQKQEQNDHSRRLKSQSAFGFSSETTTDTITTDHSVNSLSSSIYSTSESISTDTDYEHEIIDRGKNNNLITSSKSGLSISKLSLYSDKQALLPEIKNQPDSLVSAESVAISLLKRFNENQLPAASEIEWLLSERDITNKTRSSPITIEEAEEQLKQATLLRGTFEWAPPRPQIIFTLHPPPIRKQLLEKQGYRCAGCGMRVLQKYASKFKYCEYLGRYFCTGCHCGQEYTIPGKVLSNWDFGKGSVSKFSFKLIDQMLTDPLFNLNDLNPSLYQKVRVLKKIRTLRWQLFYLKDYIFICKFAQSCKDSLLKEQPHILKEPHCYSLQDLIMAKSGKLLSVLMEHVKNSINHIHSCQFCKANGFICEICNGKEIIFPWDFDHVYRCNKCGSCYHLKCYKKKYVCPKCLRKMRRDDERNNSANDKIS